MTPNNQRPAETERNLPAVIEKPSLPVKVDISPEEMSKALQLRHENRQTVKEPILPELFTPQTENFYKEPIRLNFGDEAEPRKRKMQLGASGRLVGRAVGAVLATASMAAHAKVREVEDENSAVKGAHKTETMAELSVRSAAKSYNRRRARQRNRLRDEPLNTEGQKQRTSEKTTQTGNGGTYTDKGSTNKPEPKSDTKKLQQRTQIKREYQLAARAKAKGGASTASKSAKKAVSGKADKVKELVTTFFKNHKGFFIALAILCVLFVLMLIGLGSCSSMIAGTSTPIITTTYPSTDKEMHDTENAYADFEISLNEQIGRIKQDYLGYATYNYNLSVITHNPYYLISYFSAKYGDFTYGTVKSELAEIFRQQYSLSLYSESEVIEHRETVYEGDPPTAVEVVTYETIYHLYITLTDNGLDTVLRSRMTAEEQELYDLYNMTYGNRTDLFP